jgi:hypothetical protein
MRRLALIFAALLAVTACKPGAVVTCPSLKQYSAAFQKEAAREYALVEKMAPHLMQMVDDYGVERSAIRACIKRRK